MFSKVKRCCSDLFRLMCSFVPVFFQIGYGVFKLSRLPRPRVTFFGGARFKQGSEYAKVARSLAGKLADCGVSVITGGGPGIMEAANCGVDLVKKPGHAQTMGIMVTDINGERVNKCSQVQVKLKYFFARKWLLTRYVSGFVVFPGGFGTLDELMEVLTLIKTKKLKKVPIILFGSEYWRGMLDWLAQNPISTGAVTKAELALIKVTDSEDFALKALCKGCGKK